MFQCRATTRYRTTRKIHGPAGRQAETGGVERCQRRYARLSYPGLRFSIGIPQRHWWCAACHPSDQSSREERRQQRQPGPRGPPVVRKRDSLPGGLPVDENEHWPGALGHSGGHTMSLFSAISVGASGMAAQRARAEVLVENLANAETTRTPEGGPYRRKDLVFESSAVSSPFGSVFSAELQSPGGVAVAGMLTDMSEPER